MAVIAIASAKGSPGVSLAAHGLVHCWPRPVVGMELDESGGTWAYRHGLTCEPGLASLAATQQPLDLALAIAHGYRINESKALVCAPKEGTIVRAAVGWLGERILAWPDTGDLVLDIGRLHSGEMPQSVALRRADIVILMTGRLTGRRTRLDRIDRCGACVNDPADRSRAFALCCEWSIRGERRSRRVERACDASPVAHRRHGPLRPGSGGRDV
jgi:hypothetical protein